MDDSRARWALVSLNVLHTDCRGLVDPLTGEQPLSAGGVLHYQNQRDDCEY